MSEGFRATGGCRCNTDPVRYEYTKEPFEVHYCLCTDCTDISGGALALIAVVERDKFRITQSEEKIKNFDTKETAHRKFCGDCGCHMFLEVDPFPDHVLVHVPTLDRDAEVGGKPDRWVFTDSKLELVQLPEDGLPQYSGWANSPVAS
jgi:S-(hydroxymethyl)glutathione synthase